MITINPITSSETLTLLGHHPDRNDQNLVKLDAANNEPSAVEKISDYLNQIPELKKYENVVLNLNISSISLTKELYPDIDTNALSAMFVNIEGTNILCCYDNTTISDIAHEMQHFMDAADGRLISTSDDNGNLAVIWDGVMYPHVNPITLDSKDIDSMRYYVNQPWERRAYEFMLDYCSETERKVIERQLAL